MRTCSLLPSATEIVAELGLVGSLVGISEECDWPPEARGLPIVTASRVDTTRLSSLEIDNAVREAVGDGRPLYAIVPSRAWRSRSFTAGDPIRRRRPNDAR
jgi:iron complex transport system substrate-binding protein